MAKTAPSAASTTTETAPVADATGATTDATTDAAETTTDAAGATTEVATDAASSTETSTSTTDTTTATDTTASVVPETYTLALPKDSTLDAGLLERTAATARTLGLSNEAAQSLVDQTHAEVTQFLEREHKAFEAKAQEWKTAVLGDPKYGKTEQERLAAIDKGRAVIDVHFAKADPDGAAALKTFLNESAYGNHPAVVSLMHYLGLQAADGPLHLPTLNEGGPAKSEAELFYGPTGGRPNS